MNNLPITNGTNGNGKHKQPAEIPPLPEHLETEAKSFFANYVHGRHELGVAKQELGKALVRIAELEAEIDGLHRERVMLESRATSSLMERDQAVADRAVRETILASIQVLLVQAGVPRIVQLADDDQVEAAEG